jgi:hypothetical protein
MQENTQPPQGENDALLQALNDTKEDRAALKTLLDPLFVSVWADFLNIVFEWFPHNRGDRSENERTFQAIRHRVLRVGNDAKREMSNILEDFAITQLRLRVVDVRYHVKGHGPFNLPPNVKLRAARPANVE